MIGRRRLHDPGEVPVVEGEAPALHDHPGDDGAVAADELGCRVDHDVGAMLDGPAQVGRGKGVVHHQRHPEAVSHLGRHSDVEHVALGIADRLPVDQLGAGGNGRLDGVRVVDVDEGDVDAHAAQRHVELGVGTPVQGTGGDHLVALPAQGEDGDELGRLARRGGQRTQPSFERRHPLLEGGGGGVADAGVDVAVGLEGEEVGRLLWIVEDERRGGVDGHRPGSRLRIGGLPGVDGPGVETELAVCHRSSW